MAWALITHEVPFLMTNHPVAYEGVDAARPLEPGMVLSVETTMLHPTRGFIKIEDTMAITETGLRDCSATAAAAGTGAEVARRRRRGSEPLNSPDAQ